MESRFSTNKGGRPMHGDKPKRHITARIDADVLELFEKLEGTRSGNIEAAMIRFLNMDNDHKRAERLKMQNTALLEENDELRRDLGR